MKAAEPFLTKRMSMLTVIFNPKDLAYKPSQLPCHLHSPSTNQLVFLSQTVMFPTFSFGTRNKQFQRLPKMSWGHDYMRSSERIKCCGFSLATHSTTACYTKSVAKLPPLLQEKKKKKPKKLM